MQMRKSAIALSVSLLSAATLAQDVVVFGDSLSDVGQTGWLNKATYAQTDGSLNALYNEYLAQALGSTLTASSQGGTDYAYSGGVVLASNSAYSAVQPNVAVDRQIQNYLSDGVKSGALHVLWAGGNDMPQILARALASANASQSVQTDGLLTAFASAQQWASLKSAGVNLIVAPTVPNVAYTPALFQQFGSSVATTLGNTVETTMTGYGETAKNAFLQAFSAASAYLDNSSQTSLTDFDSARIQVLENTVAALYQSQLGAALSALMDQTTLTAQLVQQYQQFAAQAATATAYLNSATTSALNKVGGNIVRIDTDALFKEMLSNPADFGLTNTVGTVCTSTTQSLCTVSDQAVENRKLFADSFHPGAVAHKVMADYILNVLQAPTEAGVLAQLALQSTEKTLDFARGQSNRNRWLKQEEKTVEGVAAYQHHDKGAALYAGFKAQFTPHWQFGTLLSHHKQKGTQGSTKGEIQSRAISSTLRYDADKWWIGAVIQLSDNDYETTRQIRLGPANRSQQGETSGAVFSAGLFGGYQWQSENHRLALLTDVTRSQGKVTGFTEKNLGATQLYFGEQKIRSTRSGVGAEYRYAFENWQPYVAARWVKEWQSSPSELTVGLNGSQFHVALAQRDKSWLNTRLGLDRKANASPWLFQLAVQRDVGRRDNFSGTTFQAGVGYTF